MKKFLLIFFFVAFAANVSASCANPTISISTNSTSFYAGGDVNVSLVYSANPPIMTRCVCLLGADCGMTWQDDSNGSWVKIPTATDAQNDLNCSGENCTTGTGHPIEDATYSRLISCVSQKVYHIRGFQPSTGIASASVTVYCYPSLACMPPSSGNFNLNQTCNYVDVPLFIDGNYNLGSSGHALHNGSDVNFFSSGAKYLNIQNGGQIDLNQSNLFAGLTIPIEFGGPILGGLMLLLVLGSMFIRRNAVEVMG